MTDRDQPPCEAVLLGPVQFLRGNRPVQFPTRKALAVCTFLATRPGANVDRNYLCGLLWGESDGEAARVSLRKAVSLIATSEDTRPFIARERAFVRYSADAERVDLSMFRARIAENTERGYREAALLWRGEPLQSAEIGESAYDDWVREFRVGIVSQTMQLLKTSLADMATDSAQSPVEIALCELIAHIEPTEVAATERLVRVHAARGDWADAVRRLRVLRKALKELEVPLPPHLLALERSLRNDAPGAALIGNGGFPAAPFHGAPTVILQQPLGMRQELDLYSFVHSEVMCQLTRFRTMRCFEPLPVGGEGGTGQSDVIRIDGGLEHDYRVLLWNEPNARALYLRCVNARRLETVSCVRIGYEDLADHNRAGRLIAKAINTIERDILNDEPPHPGTPFARWLTAYKEMQKFTPRSDDLALEILNDLAEDPRGSRLSLVHSALTAIHLKRSMYYPGTAQSEEDAGQARARAQLALSLDEHEPFNHVMGGWLSIKSRDHERALAYFDDALTLNPHSSRTLISAAEARAFCGDLAGAKTLAERAMALSGRLAPAYFHGYLATIAYLDGNLEECTRRLHRAPENMHTLLLSIAAYQEREETGAVSRARTRLERELRLSEAEQRFDHAALARWVVDANMTRDEGARRRMFQSLERAGLPVGRDSA